MHVAPQGTPGRFLLSWISDIIKSRSFFTYAMPFGSFDAKKAAKAAEEFSQQMGEIYRHECYGQRKRECKLKEKVIPKKKRLILLNANIYKLCTKFSHSSKFHPLKCRLSL